MLELIYLTHFRTKSQKSLAYAIALAKAFSSPLSILSLSRINESFQRKIVIWQPPKGEKGNHSLLVSREDKKNTSRKTLPLFLLGLPDHPERLTPKIYNTVMQVLHQGFPLLLLPFNYAFNRIRNVLFTGNSPGFTDHYLKHRIAATFLPRAFKLENAALKQIHWNNICQIAEGKLSLRQFSCEALKAHIRQQSIDLTIIPVTNSCDSITSVTGLEIRELFRYKGPTLLIPLPIDENFKS
ncbi:MAG: hypothetical protein R2828_28150 [Saprospiraceae bacterium]